MSGGVAAAVAAIGLLGVIAIVVIVYILIAAGLWKTFLKMGEPGWKGIIPVYNLYTQYKHTFKTSMFWAVLALAVVSGILSGVAGDEPGMLMSLLLSLLSLAQFVIIIMGFFYLYKSFGRGIGWVILSIFVPYIMMMALGFGSARYLGNAYLNRR